MALIRFRPLPRQIGVYTENRALVSCPSQGFRPLARLIGVYTCLWDNLQGACRVSGPSRGRQVSIQIRDVFATDLSDQVSGPYRGRQVSIQNGNRVEKAYFSISFPAPREVERWIYKTLSETKNQKLSASGHYRGRQGAIRNVRRNG